jgi:N-acetyl sugar amidotransferase
MLNLINRIPMNMTRESITPKFGAFCDFKEFRQCNECLMDTTDPEISFNVFGTCSYCQTSKGWEFVRVNSNPKELEIEKMVDEIKKNKSKDEFDCIIGISGGVDSSYLALLAVEWGLNPLFVHIDAGWNTNVANENINKLLNKLNKEIYTLVIDWEKIRVSQIAFLKSGIANLDVPQDYLFTKGIIQVALKFKIKNILSGSNMATESILPTQWGYDAQDPIHINAIHKKYIEGKEKGIDVANLVSYAFDKKLKANVFKYPLDLVPYSRNHALETLNIFCDWKNYGPKHFESRWTRYFQGYLLPLRFGYDKRKPHLSSRIVSGEITLTQAYKEMEDSKYPINLLTEDEKFICSKLEIKQEELDKFKQLPLSHYSDYAHLNSLSALVRFRRSLIRRISN